MENSIPQINPGHFLLRKTEFSEDDNDNNNLAKNIPYSRNNNSININTTNNNNNNININQNLNHHNQNIINEIPTKEEESPDSDEEIFV
jgi:hypothetical protein